MPADDDAIFNAAVDISPDTTGFKQKLEAQLKKALAGINPVIKVQLVADKTGFVKTVYTELAKIKAKPQFKVKLVADSDGFLTSVRTALKKEYAKPQPEYKVKVVADVQRGGGGGAAGGRGDGAGKSGAERAVEKMLRDQYLRRARTVFEEVTREQLDSWRRAYEQQDKMDQDSINNRLRRARNADERLIHDVQSAERAAYAERKKRERDHLLNNEKAERDSFNRRRDRANEASKALAAPQLIDFGGRGVRPMNLLYGAVAALTPALFAMGTSAVQAASGVAALGAAGTGAALGISALAISFSSISEVLKLRTGANNAKLLATAKSSPREQANSIRDLANAQRDEKAAYAAIHDARREAIRDLEDLRQAVIDLDNEYKSNKLSVAEAEQNEAATNRNFFATALDRARAHQDTLDARTKLSDTTLERKQKRQDLARSVKVGVEGSDKVLQARERARDARDRRLDLQDQKSKNAAAGLDGTGAAAAQLEQKLKELSPAGREMYKWFDANDKKLKELRRTIEQGTLPGFTKFLQAVSKAPKGGKSTLQLAAEYAAQLGGIIGKYAGRFGKITTMGFFRKDMATIQKNNATALDTLGKAAERLMRPMLRIFTAASPLLVKFADKLLDLATQFDTFIEKANSNGSLTQWFEDTAEQAKQWWRILVNAGRFLRDLFTAARPAGGSLVKDFADYMERLANWSSSEAGQKSIKDFFDTIANLPYAQIRDMLIQLSELFLAKHVASWAAANPLFTAIGIIIAGNPALAISFLKALTYFVETGARIVSANPELTALVLAMVSLSKLNKATGGALFAVTGLDKLKDVLTGKFKVLDKFIGGASTSVMNVRAGVVNVYGASIKGGGAGSVGGGLDFPEADKGKGKVGKPSRISKATNAVGTGNIVMAAALAGYAIGQDELDRVKDLLSGKGKDAFHTWNNAITKKPFDASNWYDTFVDNSLVVMLPLLAKKLLGGKDAKKTKADPTARPLQTAMGDEAYAMSRVQNVAGWAEKGSGVFKSAIDNWVEKRRVSVQKYVDWVRSTKGPMAAADAQVTEDRKSATELSRLMRQYGYTKDAAKTYADYVFKAGAETKTSAERAKYAATQFDSMGNALDTTKGKTKALHGEVAGLKDTINATVGPHVIALSTKNYDAVKKQLDMLYATQHVLYNPAYSNSASGADTVSSQNQFLDPKTGLPKKYMKAAGGHITGPGTATSDSIPAWLSDGEYVMPAKTVQHYGLGAMEAMRKRQLPAYADGGPVMPFVVNLPKKGFQFPEVVGIPGTGPNGPAFTGKVPKGVGAIAGVNAQLAAAAIDAHQMMKAHVTSGLRTGRAAITVTGNKSYHGFGRAIDLVPPSMALFNYLRAKYGKFAREIIYSPAGNEQIWRGKPHMYTGKVRDTHWNHVHLALARGGLVQPRKFDTGGVLPPGYTLAFNGTGRNETVRTDRQERQVQGPVRLDRRDITLLAAAVNTGTSTTVSMDGRRVAELTNRYNYLPAGV